MDLHLVNLIKDRIGTTSMLYVSPRFDDYQDARVMVIDCQPSKTPVFVKDGGVERFYVRTGAATSELPPSQTPTHFGSTTRDKTYTRQGRILARLQPPNVQS